MERLETGSTAPLAARVEETTDQVRRITKLLRVGSQEDWTSLSLTRAQLRILTLLQQEGSAAVGQIAAYLGVTLPSVTATVDRLVQQELVSPYLEEQRWQTVQFCEHRRGVRVLDRHGTEVDPRERAAADQLSQLELPERPVDQRVVLNRNLGGLAGASAHPGRFARVGA